LIYCLVSGLEQEASASFIDTMYPKPSSPRITFYYWESLELIKIWKEHALHQVAQKKGQTDWYKRYGLRVCKVERDNFFEV
jgi:heme-degrading monooxygenase HmoA